MFVIRFIPYWKDFKVIKQKEFETITGTVIKYTYIREENNPNDPIQLIPIVKEVDSEKQINSNVIGTKLYRKYTFLYLPNTHIAIIIPDD